MTRDFDDRLRDFLDDKGRRVVLDAPSIEAAIGRLATQLRPKPTRVPGRLVVLLAAALLVVAALGSAIAIGSGVLRLPLVIDVPAPLESQDSSSAEPRSADRGGLIAYATESGMSSVFLVRPGEEPQQIAPSGGGVANDVVCPTFSPDGTLLAVGMPGGSTVILPVDEQGLTGDLGRRVDAGASESPHCAAWAPDSSALALLDDSALFIVSLAGQRQRIEGWDVADNDRNFATDYPADRAVQWSPDGSAIAVARPSGTWLIPVDGTTPRRLHETPAFSASWSPDGTRLVVGAKGPKALVIRVADGETLAELPTGFGPPVWSPVEDRIALSDADARLVVIRPDGTGRAVIDDYGYHPTWSSDGEQLLYIQDAASAAWKLLTADADGSGEPAIVVGSVAMSSARSFPGAEQISWRPLLPDSP